MFLNIAFWSDNRFIEEIFRYENFAYKAILTKSHVIV